METLIGILNWNQPVQTIDCYHSLKKLEGEKQLLLIDNGSDPIFRQPLLDFAKKNGLLMVQEMNLAETEIHSDALLLLEKNNGYAKGNNFGLRIAHQLGARFFLLSNNDILVHDPKTLLKLRQALLENPAVGVVGPRVVTPGCQEHPPRNKNRVYALGIRPLLYPLLILPEMLLRRLAPAKTDQLSFPFSVTGAFQLMDVQKLFQVGYLDENTFLFGEESILAHRLAEKNWRVAYLPSVEVLHLHEQSVRALNKKEAEKHFLASNHYFFQHVEKRGKWAYALVWVGQKSYRKLWNPVKTFCIKHKCHAKSEPENREASLQKKLFLQKRGEGNPRASVVCVFNKPDVLQEFLLDTLDTQTLPHERILLDNTTGTFASAASALNFGAKKAQSPLLLFAHQDIAFQDPHQLESIVEQMATLPPGSIAGAAGTADSRGTLTAITHGIPPRFAGKVHIHSPQPCQTLDECLVAVPAKTFAQINFDPDTCPGWHHYSTDLCLQAHQKGFQVYSIPLHLYHRSPGSSVDRSYFTILQNVVKKHRSHFPEIFVSGGGWPTSRMAFKKLMANRRFRYEAQRMVRKVRKKK